VKAVALFVFAFPLCAQEPPKDVLEFFRTTAEALADKDASAFLGHFDRAMPGYDTLESEVRALLDRSEVTSTIEIISDQGDDAKRTLQLDWLLRVDQDLPRRQIVKCTVERRGKQWKITALEPVGFFQPSP
jgi:hypothetical protein